MINTKKIYNELLNNSQITNIINEDSIFDAYPNEVEIFPCIIFLDGNQIDTEFADNLPIANDCNVEIHIFTKTEEGYPTTSDIGIVIGEVFKENYFVCTNNTEISDVRPNVKHRIMSFRKGILS